jgi:hypothetical protein
VKHKAYRVIRNKCWKNVSRVWWSVAQNTAFFKAFVQLRTLTPFACRLFYSETIRTRWDEPKFITKQQECGIYFSSKILLKVLFHETQFCLVLCPVDPCLLYIETHLWMLHLVGITQTCPFVVQVALKICFCFSPVCHSFVKFFII